MDDERKYIFFRELSWEWDLNKSILVARVYTDACIDALRTQVIHILKPLQLGAVNSRAGRIGGCYNNAGKYVAMIGSVHTFQVLPSSSEQQQRPVHISERHWQELVQNAGIQPAIASQYFESIKEVSCGKSS